jgi:transposase-like protein
LCYKKSPVFKGIAKMNRNNYTKEFKAGAARMVLQEKQSATQVAKNLGVSSGALSKWVRNYKELGVDAFPGKGGINPRDEEIRDLKLALRRTEMERDLLKKTIALFAVVERKNIRL